MTSKVTIKGGECSSREHGFRSYSRVFLVVGVFRDFEVFAVVAEDRGNIVKRVLAFLSLVSAPVSQIVCLAKTSGESSLVDVVPFFPIPQKPEQMKGGSTSLFDLIS